MIYLMFDGESVIGADVVGFWRIFRFLDRKRFLEVEESVKTHFLYFTLCCGFWIELDKLSS